MDHKPLPKGCDYQGRYPEAAHAAADEYEEQEPVPWYRWYTWVDFLIALAIPAVMLMAIAAVYLVAWKWLA